MTTKTFGEMAAKIANLVEEKEKAYGSAFDKTGDFVKLLYPNGAKPEQYKDMLCIVRIFDKLMRIATSYEGTEEKKVDAYSDIIGYGLLGLRAASMDGDEKAVDEKNTVEISEIPLMKEDGTVERKVKGKLVRSSTEDILADQNVVSRWSKLAFNSPINTGILSLRSAQPRLYPTQTDVIKAQIDQIKELAKLSPKIAEEFDAIVEELKRNSEEEKREKRIKTVATDCMSAFPSETAKTLLHADGTGNEAPKEAEEESPNRWKDLAFKAPLRNRPMTSYDTKLDYIEYLNKELKNKNIDATERARLTNELSEVLRTSGNKLATKNKQDIVKAACKLEPETIHGPQPEEMNDFSKRTLEKLYGKPWSELTDFQKDFIPEKKSVQQ